MPEEPCQCPDCQRFYREHDRLIRENPTLRQQQELNWAALQSFRTLAGRALEELQKIHGDGESAPSSSASLAPAVPPGSGHGDEAEADAIQQAIGDLENINAHLFSIEALMERIFDSGVLQTLFFAMTYSQGVGTQRTARLDIMLCYQMVKDRVKKM